MSAENKTRDFYMDTDILDRALDSCDLGDGYMAKVRQYPHKDMRPYLTAVIEKSAYLKKCEYLDKAHREIKRLREALGFYADAKNWEHGEE